ncbi:hypothetical protein FA95DRAFT_1561637 [Auriscalpium vulgare]|uniref:Uncharacterized protein n=1 Tax=Auriscalpium vulgare TaxID=40419 RepID=A0ACB8RLI8_9AGAM|nr:hypothetical protein FA95DRAFT_1561637 [Auriscalpium vulgare]
MENPHLVIPRLRLTRQGSSSQDATPTAGPSRLALHDEEDAESTPRMPVHSFPSPSATSPGTSLVDETPAARLRAVMARMSGMTSQTQILREPTPSLPSDLDSDFDGPPPKWNARSASMARESLKDLFSNVLQETPQKQRAERRRNSIDASEVEDSPRVQRVAQERSRAKGKRKSLSDDEPSRSTPAANFDALRSRLENASVEPSESAAETSNDTATILRQMNASSSTPMRSVQFPSTYQNDSNLLDQDSEMQRAMGAFESFDGESARQDRPPFPPLADESRHDLTKRPRGSLARAGSLTDNNLVANASRRAPKDLSRRDSDDISSHASSSVAASPKPPSTPHRDSYHHHRASHSQTGSPLPEPPSRRGSVVSLRSVDSDISSRPSSIGSNMDYQERIKDVEKDRQHERERAWNRPAAGRSSSSLSLHHSGSGERSRTHSYTARPDSALSHLSSSVHSSRASSPNGSVRSHDAQSDEVAEVVHERERNWNAVHPKWSHGRPVSPLPANSTRAPLHPSPTPSPSHSRVRTQSLGGRSPQAPPRIQPHHTRVKRSPSQSSLNASHQLLPRAVSPSPQPHRTDPRPSQPSPRPTSPLPSASSKANGAAKSSVPGFSSSFGWKFPRAPAQLPPLQLDDSSPERPSTPAQRPSSRLGGSAGRQSHIPVRSPGKIPKVENLREGEPSAFAKRHKRANTEFAEANGAIPPRILVESEPEESSAENGDADSVRESDEDIQDAVTPVAKPIIIPDVEELQTPSMSPSRLTAEHGLQKAIVPPTAEDVRHKSPPRPFTTPPLPSSPTPSTPPPKQSVLDLITPPRRTSFSTTRLEFRTPSPPKGLPDLPGPPTSSEDEGADEKDRTPVRQNGNAEPDYSSMKTPRPPGAWAATPAREPEAQPPIASSSTSPSPSSKARTRSNSLPDSRPAAESVSTPVQPKTPSALARSNTLPSRTPAPPGAWTSTPGSLRRKSLMKVRFENPTDESAISDVGEAASKQPKVELPHAEWEERPYTPLEGDSSISEPSFTGVVESSPAHPNARAEAAAVAASEIPRTPSHSPRHKLRKSPSIRMVDEYGRDEAEQAAIAARKAEKIKDKSMSMRMPGGSLSTPRNKSVIRMLDAMGREVEEPAASDNGDSEDTVTQVKISRPEAVARMKQTAAELHESMKKANGLDAADFYLARVEELNGVSRAARDERSKISSSLSKGRGAQSGFRSSPQNGSAIVNRAKGSSSSRTLWTAWLPWVLFCILPILTIIILRTSQIYARRLFLTTYFDPFHSELHLHPTKPEFNYDANIFAFIRRMDAQSSYPDGRFWIIDSLVAPLRSISDVIARIQRQAWDTWGAPDHELRRNGSWPPT